MIEIEMKAWVRNYSQMKTRLELNANFVKKFCKIDRYYILNNRIFRIRQNKGENNFVVTIKTKKKVDCLEINNEVEFSVSDYVSFYQFSTMLGAEIFIEKVKKGILYEIGNYHFELCHIEGLGDFLEIEYLTEDENAIDGVHLQIKSYFKELGIESSDFEPAYYMDLLKKKGL